MLISVTNYDGLDLEGRKVLAKIVSDIAFTKPNEDVVERLVKGSTTTNEIYVSMNTRGNYVIDVIEEGTFPND